MKEQHFFIVLSAFFVLPEYHFFSLPLPSSATLKWVQSSPDVSQGFVGLVKYKQRELQMSHGCVKYQFGPDIDLPADFAV